ncbi:hypothetical protein FRB98_007680 [Tulasnella sp. 332]|nr:hypothetical protein FRB98_007680 [Tulasnella sp. 332]
MLRTAKWMGSEAWGLRIVVEALPTLLLISLALFFAALCDLLWSINRPVSIVVVAFTAAGAVFYGFTVIAAAIDTFSPYQTAVSIAIRDVPLGSKKLLQKSRLWISSINSRMVSNLRKRMTRVLNLIKKSLGGVSAIVRRIGEEERADAKKEIDEEESIGAKEEILYAHSLLWMLEHSTTQKDILACIDNIPALPSLHSTWIVARSPLFPTLVEKFEAALTTAVKIKTEVHEQHALALARALAHLVVADPGHCREPAKHILNQATVKNLARHMVEAFGAHDRRIATGFNHKRLLELPRNPAKLGLEDAGEWESGLENDPLVKTSLLHTQFIEYAVQLLLYLGSPSLNSQNVSYTMEEANIVIKGVIQFQDRMAADENLIHTLHTIGQVLGHSISAATDLFRSVVPFFLRALHSASTEMVTTAYHVLNNIGDRSYYKESDRTSLTAGKRLEHRIHLLEAMEFNFSVTVTPGNGDANGACREPAVRDTVMRALNFYIVNRLAFIHRDETNVEIFIFIFTFVQHTFLLRPSAALFFELDLASDILIKRVKAWIDDAQDHRSTSNDGLEDPELENLRQCWMGARRAYAGISRAWDVSLRCPLQTGWWKCGGMSEACEASRFSMLF